MDEKTFSTQQAADYIGANRQTVQRWIREKKLQATKRKRGLKFEYVIKQTDLDAFIKNYLNQ